MGREPAGTIDFRERTPRTLEGREAERARGGRSKGGEGSCRAHVSGLFPRIPVENQRQQEPRELAGWSPQGAMEAGSRSGDEDWPRAGPAVRVWRQMSHLGWLVCFLVIFGGTRVVLLVDSATGDQMCADNE